MRWLLLLSLAVSAPVVAQDEDAAHHVDRAQTQELNRRAAAIVAGRDAGNSAGRSGYAQARARYERQMAEWRARVAACENGDWRACDQR